MSRPMQIDNGGEADGIMSPSDVECAMPERDSETAPQAEIAYCVTCHYESWEPFATCPRCGAPSRPLPSPPAEPVRKAQPVGMVGRLLIGVLLPTALTPVTVFLATIAAGTIHEPPFEGLVGGIVVVLLAYITLPVSLIIALAALCYAFQKGATHGVLLRNGLILHAVLFVCAVSLWKVLPSPDAALRAYVYAIRLAPWILAGVASAWLAHFARMNRAIAVAVSFGPGFLFWVFVQITGSPRAYEIYQYIELLYPIPPLLYGLILIGKRLRSRKRP